MLDFLARIALPTAVTVLLAAGVVLARRRLSLRGALARLRPGTRSPRAAVETPEIPEAAVSPESAASPASPVALGTFPAPTSAGGPFLHWVPDRQGGWRLAGDYLPPPTGSRSRRPAPHSVPRP